MTSLYDFCWTQKKIFQDIPMNVGSQITLEPTDPLHAENNLQIKKYINKIRWVNDDWWINENDVFFFLF